MTKRKPERGKQNMEQDQQPTNGRGGDEHIQRLGPSMLEKVVEALIFSADEPVTPAHIARIYSDITGEDSPTPDQVEEAVQGINAWYELSERCFRVHKWAGGFRMATLSGFSPFISALHEDDRKRRLSRSLMETLAVLAYRQPAAKSAVDFVRGVDCDYAIRKLLEHGLIDVVGRSEKAGRPLLYGTTDVFLELFGIDSIDDLPNLRELEDILDDPAFHKEKARLMMSPDSSLTGSAYDPGSKPESAAPESPPEEIADPHADEYGEENGTKSE